MFSCHFSCTSGGNFIKFFFTNKLNVKSTLHASPFKLGQLRKVEHFGEKVKEEGQRQA